MATYQITINERTTEGKRFLTSMKSLPFVSINKNSAGKKKKMTGLDEAIKDIEEGRVSKPMTFEEFKDYTKKIWDKA